MTLFRGSLFLFFLILLWKKQDDTIERIEERMREGVYHSTFTFGGGFVIITFMKKKFVDELHWIAGAVVAMLGCIFCPEVEKMQSDSGNESVWSDRNVCLRIDRRTTLEIIKIGKT